MITPAAPSMLWKIGYRVVNIVRFQSDVPARNRGVGVVQSRTYHREGNVVLVHQIPERLSEAVTADRILEIARARGHPEELPRPLPGDGAEPAFLIFLPRPTTRFLVGVLFNLPIFSAYPHPFCYISCHIWPLLPLSGSLFCQVFICRRPTLVVTLVLRVYK